MDPGRTVTTSLPDGGFCVKWAGRELPRIQSNGTDTLRLLRSARIFRAFGSVRQGKVCGAHTTGPTRGFHYNPGNMSPERD